MMPLDLFAFALAGPVAFLAILAAIALTCWCGWWLLLRQRKTLGLQDDRDAEHFAGQSVAYDAESGEYICSDIDRPSLRATMRERHIGRRYLITEYPERASDAIHVLLAIGDCQPDAGRFVDGGYINNDTGGGL